MGVARVAPRHRKPQPAPARKPSALEPVLVVAASAYVAMVVAVAVLRMSYPFELEWLEGLVLEHVQRLLHGRALYVRPSLEFIPLNYTPLYFWAGAAVSKLMGEGFLPLRLVS